MRSIYLQGDDCLKSVAKSIESQLLRPIDIAARYGGEEFAILLPNTDVEGACNVATRQLAGIASLKIPHEHSSSSEYVSLSMGISSNKTASDIQELINQADEALYQSKKNGRNRMTTWTSQ